MQGKALSYNNIADADAAWECVKTFSTEAAAAPGAVGAAAACVIVKHANPCGVALGASVAEAYAKALQTDPTSAFGGIIAFNRPLDGAAAELVAKQFVEVVIAPAITAEARAVFAPKQNVRLLEVPLAPGANAVDFKRVGGGVLMQAPDTKNVGAGQMSRVDSARIAGIKANNAGLTLAGSAVASDAFFPFRDGLDVVVDAGAACVVQPGGSMRDDEVIKAADERGIAMVFTGTRHFRH